MCGAFATLRCTVGCQQVVRAGELTLRFGGVDHGALAAGTLTVLKREAESESNVNCLQCQMSLKIVTWQIA